MNNIKFFLRLIFLLLTLFLFAGCSQGERNKREDKGEDTPQSVSEKENKNSTKEQYQRIQVDISSIQENLSQLCANVRSVNAENKESSRKFLEDKMQEYGYKVKRQEFNIYRRENDNFTMFPEDTANDFFDFPKTKTSPVGTGINIIAENKNNNENKKTIYITAHYDTSSWTTGVLDNGTGVVVTLEVAKALQKYDGEFNVVCVLFDVEEVAQQGSLYFINQMTDVEKEKTVACLNVDMVGEKDAGEIIMRLGRGEPNIVSLAFNKILNKSVITSQGVTTDEMPFYYGELPAVTLINENPVLSRDKETDQFQYVDYEKLSGITNDLCDFVERLDDSIYQKLLKEDEEISSQLEDVYDLQNADYQSQYVVLIGNGAVPETVVIYRNKQGKEFKVSMRAGCFFDQDKLKDFKEINTTANTNSQTLYYYLRMEESLVEYYSGDWYGMITGNLTEDEYMQILEDIYNSINYFY